MITLLIPGFKTELRIEHLVLDFNGTLAIDGKLIHGVKERLIDISKQLTVHVITGNSFGTAREVLKDIPCTITILADSGQANEKEKYIQQLDPSTVISIGNGYNDRFLLKKSAIGIALIQDEGASAQTLIAADIVFKDILSALDLINNPTRIKATLRS